MVKIIVSVCIHNRFENLKKWVNCWNQADTTNAELIIIHNYYGDHKEAAKFWDYCYINGIKCIPRNGPGFDIGAFQDVCRNRLNGFPNYDYLLWCADDTFPMSKDFIKSFIDKIQEPGVGISCMQLSNSIAPHVRTSGFCISKNIAEKLVFPADPVTTKQHCYFFEHRGGAKTFTYQVRQMGLSIQAVSKVKDSPLWDSDHPNKNKRLDRKQEFDKSWNIKPNKVVFICPIFDAFPEIISSLICQSNKNWELLLIDDNPEETISKTIVEAVNDSRITYIKRKREANYGHPHRRWALNEIKEGRLSDADYIVITNGDNQYTPNFIKDMMNGFKNGSIATYSQKMIHSYKNWDVINCKLELGYLDCGGVMVRKDVACAVGWSDITSHSSDWTYFQDIIKQHGSGGFVAVPGCLFIHN